MSMIFYKDAHDSLTDTCRYRQKVVSLQRVFKRKLADNMEYLSVNQYAEKYGISERTARNYCALGKIEGTFLTGKTWNIPADAPHRHQHPQHAWRHQDV